MQALCSGLLQSYYSGDNSKSVFMRQPRSFLLFTEAILQLSQIVTSEFIAIATVVTVTHCLTR